MVDVAAFFLDAGALFAGVEAPPGVAFRPLRIAVILWLIALAVQSGEEVNIETDGEYEKRPTWAHSRSNLGFLSFCGLHIAHVEDERI